MKNYFSDLDKQGCVPRHRQGRFQRYIQGKDSRQQGQTQSWAGLDTSIGDSRLPQSPLEFLKSLLTAGRIRFRVWGGTSWAPGGTQVDPDVGRNRGEVGNQASPDINNQLIGTFFFFNFTVSLKSCRHSLKPVSSAGSRFIHTHCTVILQVQDYKMQCFFLLIAVYCSMTLGLITVASLALQISRDLLHEHWQFWKLVTLLGLGLAPATHEAGVYCRISAYKTDEVTTFIPVYGRHY